MALGPALSRRPLPVRIGPVETDARSTSPILLPLPVAADADLRGLILAPGTGADALRPVPMRRPAAPRAAPVDVLRDLAQYRPAEPTAVPGLAGPEREAALAGVFSDIAADPDATHRPAAVVYQDFLVRCRMRGASGEGVSLATFRRRLAAARAGFGGEEGAEAMPEAAAAACAALPEEVQGLFLTLARAALSGAPCPSDEDLARAIGSRSPGRARRLLAYVEQQGHAVSRTDFRGNRVVALPALNAETAPGDPKAVREVVVVGGLFAAE